MSVATQRNTQLDTERRNDRLSMRAAREAQNSLETTLTNVRGRQDGLDQAEAAARLHACLLYTSDAADDNSRV